jgi:succinoglycan biosynthesis protein ExoM
MNGSGWGRVTVTIATFRRLDDLTTALESMADVRGIDSVDVIVIDNDTTDSARALVESFSHLPVADRSETAPGIAAARNAALDAGAESDWLVFVDDDETFDPGWLEALLDCGVSGNADIVAGPVITLYPESTPRWIVRGGFMQRSRMPTGPLRRKRPATNNVAVRMAYWRDAGRPRFDETFSVTGGSDTDFFSRLIGPNATVLWCDEAIVSEVLPRERANVRWILRRMVRLGNVDGRLRLRSQSRLALVLAAVGRIGYGVVRTLGAVVTGRGVRRRDVGYITVGLGWIGAATGALVQEYRRLG